MRPLLAFGAIWSLSLTGCFSHDGWAKTHNREQLLTEVSKCNEGEPFSCLALGDDLLGKTTQSRTSDWQQGRDAAGAKRAYRRACLLGLVRGCAAIVEYGLATTPEEKARYEIRTKYQNGTTRTPEEIAADDAKMRASVRERNKELAAERAAEERSSQQSWAAFGQAVQQSAPQIQESANRLAGGKGTTATTPTPTPAGAAATPGASTVRDCGCAALDTSACRTEALSPACYEAQARVNDCQAKPGCSSNPGAFAAEASRLRKAAREIKR